MIITLARKLDRLLSDPALRRWLLGRALRLYPSPPCFIPGIPGYLDKDALAVEASAGRWDFASPVLAAPTGLVRLDLPGATIELDPADPGRLFEQDFPDLETRLAVHRFAWLPLQGRAVPVEWVFVLISEWHRRFAKPDPSWVWHPYTAAERLINLMAFGRRAGLPREWRDVMAAHGPAIAGALEFFGDHYTGNHLANNGRGLYLLGLELDMPACRDLGLSIVINEARRIFAPSGILAEDSSHYQLLLTRNYITMWLAARRFHRPEADLLASVAASAWRAALLFDLPGGFPTIGDISPDCPPRHLLGLLSAEAELAGIDTEDRPQVDGLRPAKPPAMSRLVAEGWLRVDHHEWSGLWHAAPSGWPVIPGHGHQDLGGFEMHWRRQPLFVDPGRGAYGEAGEAALYRSATMHNVVQVADRDPTPLNRPYFTDSFRRQVAGDGARLDGGDDWVRLIHHGFRRQGWRQASRHWQLSENGFTLTDRIDGRGRQHIVRRLITPWPVTLDAGRAEIYTPGGRLRLVADGDVSVRPVVRWCAYGQGEAATAIEVRNKVRLPWSATLRVEVL
ncbi:heparinase II/III domain-containing protein [Magnetospirillum gryphiswaldense]|uniref:Heparinase II/III-like C-terminal domain-containing protein n=1 Tax=Magnetospirillum gryphiswaldense TaxID=55518 RepID=A4U153_9PROT|nr:heparinase II/III family protein [Magnetospirillum gryphiswaldense]AVM75609.1 Heparinase II/III-like protein [Magnetospirillum gryphiswaldense MSR-1]AVM79512.1 Heparinase II/III-like protein [Magnetospirillum gryphiswaldense]CAM76610.1 conserved hypothetical protein [Magnetospirillum gryphiswaldense MSR-1]